MKSKRFVIILILCQIFATSFAQTKSVYQQGYTAERNLAAISSLTPYSVGGVGFDNRYQGVKGTPRLFDTLLPAFLKVKNQDFYMQVAADIDLVKNSLLLIHPKTKALLLLPSDIIDEVVINSGNEELKYRLTTGMKFDKDLKETKFYQVMNEGHIPVIKMPVKTFTEADYKSVYGPDRRYDEYETKYRYYLMGPDNVFHQIQLNAKSISKLYPGKKKLIEDSFRKNPSGNTEKSIIALIDKF